MKTLILVRHAKSGWDNPDWIDFERPLNKRGLRDAPFMGNILKEKGILPDLIISSSANRAITTARAYAQAFDYKESDIRQDINIYEKGTRHIINTIKSVPNNVGTLMIFGHNPDITSLCTYFSGEYIDNVPTSGTVCIDFDIDLWDKVEERNGKLRFFEFPKKYKGKK